MFKHILLATDGSAIAGRAAAFAVDLARVHGAKLTALYVVNPYPFIAIGESKPCGFQAYMSAAQECAAHAHAHARIKALCETGGTSVQVTPLIVEDAAAHRGIVDAARSEGADLVVVGSHGRTGLSRLVLGSVAARVVADGIISGLGPLPAATDYSAPTGYASNLATRLAQEVGAALTLLHMLLGGALQYLRLWPPRRMPSSTPPSKCCSRS